MLRDYPLIFNSLKAAGVGAFFPTFQYVQQPTAKSLGFESDFLPPCSPASPAFAALRQSGIRIVVAADLIYPHGAAMPPIADDPLRATIACAGRENIYGVLSYDEPVHQGVSESEVQGLYQRVKAIDPTMPVLMVQAPMIAGQAPFASEAARTKYLQAVVRYSRFADIVGFDVYPVPAAIAQVIAPDSHGAVGDHVAAVTGYMNWLKRAMPDKRLMMVLQGFAYSDQFEPDFLRRIADPATVAAATAPTIDEMTAMTRLSISGGADTIFWWGPSLLGSVNDRSWSAMTAAISAMKAAR